MSDVFNLVAGNQELRQNQRAGREQRVPSGLSVQGHHGTCL
jgi:hypothetical protein